MLRLLFVGLLFWGLLFPVSGQEKSIELPLVSVSADKKTTPTAQGKILLSDSLGNTGAHRNLNEGLGNIAGLNLRNYGPSGISTLSIRGTSSAHTLVVWKGMPVNNPMLGQTDASLIAGPMLENAHLQIGGTSQLFTGENFGGILSLGNAAHPTANSIRAGFAAGSFSLLHQWLSLQQKTGKASVEVKAWNQQAQNDYRFRFNGEEKRQTHSFRNARGLEASVVVPTVNDIVLETSLWSQKTDRQLGPSLHESISEASQLDENHRFLVRLSRQNRDLEWNLSNGFSTDRLHYTDPRSGIFSRALMQTHSHWGELKGTLPSGFRFQTMAMVQQSQVEGNSYHREVRLSRVTGMVVSSYDCPDFPLYLEGTLRVEKMVTGQYKAAGLNLLPGFSATYQSSSLGEFRAGIFRKFRNPTLNDLYWPQAGNTALLPEQGFTSDLQWKKQFVWGPIWRFSYDLGIYRSQIRNSIQWLPVGLLWKPENVGKIEISGFTFEPELGYRKRQWAVVFGYQLHLCKSVFAENRFHGDESKGKQLMYVPFMQSMGRFSVRYRQTGFRFWLQHTGRRNTDPGGDHSLPSFYTLNLRIDHLFPLRHSGSLKTFLEIQNLTDQSYQVIVNYPLPLRQFTFGIEFHFL